MNGGRRYSIQSPIVSNSSAHVAHFNSAFYNYLLAQNVAHFGKLQRVTQESLAKTLANKLKISCRKVIRRYLSTVETEHGQRACLKVVVQRGKGKSPLTTQFGGIPLKRKRQAILVDQQPQRFRADRVELIQRLLAEECELCGATVDVQVHHVRALRDLNVKGKGQKPQWMQVMAARRRKTLVVCQPCHAAIHAGRSNPPQQK